MDEGGFEDVEIEAAASAPPRPRVGASSRRWNQFKAVGRKNLVLVRRHWLGSTASQLVAPVVVMLILRVMQAIGNSSLSKADPDPASSRIADLPSCRRGQGSGARGGCHTLLYAPAGVPWVDEVMEIVRVQNGLGVEEVGPVPNLVASRGGRAGGAPAWLEPKWCMDDYNTSLPCDVGGLGNTSTAAAGFPVELPDAACSSQYLADGHKVFPCAKMEDGERITRYMIENPGKAQNIVVFPAGYLGMGDQAAAEFPFGYELYYNQSLARFPVRENDHVLEAKRALDQAILSFSKRKNREEGEASLSGSDHPAVFNISWSPFPRPEPRLKGFSAVAVGGGYWFYLPPMIIFFTTLVDIVREKENGSRLMVSVMGLPVVVNWLVWFLQGSVFSQLSSLILIVSGLACNFDLFWNANFFVLFLMFSFFGTAMTSASQLLATLMSSVKAAQTVGYAIILVGFVFQVILGSGYGSLIYLLQSTSLPAWVTPIRYALHLYPPYLLSMMYYTVSKKSASIVNIQEATVTTGEGFSFGDLFVQPDINNTRLFGSIDVDVPAPVFCLVLLLVDTIIFGLLATYFEHVVPTGNGILHHPLFFLKPQYWFPKRRRGSHAKLEDHKDFTDVVDMLGDFENKDVIDEAVRVNEKSNHFAEDDSVILVNMLTKTYGSCLGRCARRPPKKAVDRLSVQLEKDSVFCLLGHNGAGKSTTMNVLTGIISSSSGFVSICGHNLKEDLQEVQNLIGVSPQFDCLWGELTALEHLRIYAAVKGIEPGQVESEADYCLKYVDLMDVADKPTQTYSGGMKRRLSLAIALIGDPKAIFLDEPTTGMDPVHKQEAWSMIQKMKKDRIVVLTTHSMEEADCLGDRIGIMGSGRLQCVGTSLHLKNAYGSGYRLRVFAPVKKHAVKLGEEILSKVPQSKLLRSNAGSMVFMVPFDSVDNLPAVMNLFEQQYSDQILEWSISHTTLEEVFLQVTNGCGFGMDFEGTEHMSEDLSDSEGESGPGDDDADLDSGGRSNDRLDPPEHAFEIELPQKAEDNTRKRLCSHTSAASLYGLVAKQAVLQRRQTFQLLCQVGTPLVIMLMLSFLQVLIKIEGDNLADEGSSRVLVKSIPYSLSSGFGLPFDSAQAFTNGSESLPVQMKGKYCLQHFSFYDGAGNVGALNEKGEKSGLLSHIPQHQCYLDYGEGERISAPFFESKATEEDMVASLYGDLNELNAFNMSELSVEPHPSYLLPDGTVSFKGVDPAKSFIGYSLSANDNFLLAYHRPNGITRARLLEETSASFQNTGFAVLGNQGRAYVMEMVNRAFMRSVLKSHDYYYQLLQRFPSFVKFVVGAESVLYNMPQYEESKLTNIVQIFGSFLYPIALVLQLPLYMYVSVMEKENKLRQCQLNHGMSLGLYHTSSFLFNMLMYTCIVLFMVIVGNIVNLSFFSETDQTLLFVFFFGWGLSMVAFAIFLASFINTSRIATVVGYSVVLFGTGLGIMLSQGVYGDNPTRSEMPRMPAALNLAPQFAMIRSVYLMNWSCAMKGHCISGLGSGGNRELETCIGFMYLDFILYCLVGFYLDKVLPKPNEPSSDWLFFLPRRWRKRRRGKITPINSMVEILSQTEFSDSHCTAKQDAVDEDVLEEERRASVSPPDQHELVIQNLTKEFGDKVAVQNMGLVVNKSECFGLLGENGAGKTTLINMLSCSMAPTRGTAHVAGFDVRHQSEDIQKLLGICPQFDVLWGDLTVKEHMLLFLRLKKASTAKEKVEGILNEVGLLSFQHKLVKELSGGMKRRLSVAVALAGDSRVILLDEVTTGLDPFSRRQLWNILKKCQNKRAMVLTTHSMDEAELLCTRLGIMVNGRLQCVGTSDHLKEKFGRGYILLLNFSQDNKGRVLSFLTQKFGLLSHSAFSPRAYVVSSRQGTEIVKDFPGQLMVRIPVHKTMDALSQPGSSTSAGFRMSSIFSVMVQQGEAHGISDWAVSQVGLNEVFQSVLERAKAKPLSFQETEGRETPSGPPT
ncbi:P-loop-containing nucleoside triphosphate hydrolase [Chloropicon primus]|uniref:P-loop-containing nucleoside triphosphate hydrolase n=4 Tax=Chloropicon primus TaxID=1764295 RepID=A0A5B8MIZ0_9CHLO|nr:P-loop-containing nucleoside triphosphate hydrolase [Chloropicon primus]|eukprot:QDZ20369.1 P-loop-containing nucleoside triphosphate hydrolase [Chloropicon primus]